MSLLEKDIENILYESPWLLDSNFIVPKIKGQREYGRQINIGNGKNNRYIDLLFKDTKDNRPVIVELKKGELQRVNIAQILEYKALMISMSDEDRERWKQEFDCNFICPKLMLVGAKCPEEVLISANLAGIEVRTFGDQSSKLLDLGKIDEVRDNMQAWRQFISSGEVTLADRNEWVQKKYYEIKHIVEDMNIDTLEVSKLYKTSGSYFWTEGAVFPFINICICYENEYFMGIYEYGALDNKYPYSEQDIYVDILIPCLYDGEENTKVEEKLFAELKRLKINYTYNNEGIVTIPVPRAILANNCKLKEVLVSKIECGIKLIKEINSFEIEGG